MNTRTRWTSVLSGAAALLAAAPARAQHAGFQLDRYTVPVASSDLFWLERPVVAPSLRPGVTAALGYQHDPLRDTTTDGTGPVVHDDVRSHIAASLGLFNFLQVGASLPVVLLSAGGGAQSANGPGSYASAFGDLRLDVRLRALGPAFGPGARLAVAGSVMFPTGNRTVYAGDGSVSGSARVLAEFEAPGGFRVVANAGVLFRPTIVTPGYTVDDEVFARIGLMFPLTPHRHLQATIETTATTALAYGPGFLAGNYTSVEALTGAKYMTDSGTVMGLAAGVGLTSAVGTPELRLMLTFGRGYAEPVPHIVSPGDDDRDGVLNEVDRCPTVRMGLHPDPTRRGCPSRDADRDGYADSVDNCPSESAGNRPDFDRPGCPLPDEDPDGDMVFGARDLCPDERAGRSPDPTRPGCPERDSDHDGVANATDACPDDPSLSPEGNGCPRWVRGYDGRPVIIGDVTFAAGTARMEAASLPVLDELALWLATHGEVRLRIAGRISSRGEGSHPELRHARARSVREWLTARGVDASRLEIDGTAGGALADEGSPEGRAHNRRVDFLLIGERATVGSAGVHPPDVATAITRPDPPATPASLRPRVPSARATPR